MATKDTTATKVTKKTEKSFEETLWDTGNTAMRVSAQPESEGTSQSVPEGQGHLRGSVESSEYKHVVLSLIFLRPDPPSEIVQLFDGKSAYRSAIRDLEYELDAAA